jgi:hypothetical protein
MPTLKTQIYRCFEVGRRFVHLKVEKIRSGDIGAPCSLSRFRQVAELRVTWNSLLALAEQRIEFRALNAFIVAPFLQLQRATIILIAHIPTPSSTTSSSRHNSQPL